MTTIRIRPANTPDLDALACINAEVQALHAGIRPADFQAADADALRATLAGFLAEGGMKMVVADVEWRVVAYALIEHCQRPANTFKQAGSYLLVHQMAVASAYRRRGIATALMVHIREQAVRLGVTRIEIDVYTQNDAARLFYRSLGFDAFREIMELPVGRG